MRKRATEIGVGIVKKKHLHLSLVADFKIAKLSTKTFHLPTRRGPSSMRTRDAHTAGGGERG